MIDPVLAAACERHKVGDFAGAATRYRVALAADPVSSALWRSRAALEADRGHGEAAVVCARKAVRLDPRDGHAWSNLGNALHRMERYGEALEALDVALAIDPHEWGALFNRGLTLYAIGDLAGSYAAMAGALVRAPEANQPTIAADLTWPLLAMGDYPRGFAAHENRWARLARTQVWDIGIPQWRGEEIAGRRILVHHDQGIGDDLQFCRLLPALRLREAWTILAVPPALVPLMARQGLADEVCDIDAPLPAADWHVPICSLPYRLGLRLDDVRGEPYLAPPGAAPDIPALSDTRLRVGLVWAANHIHETGRRRSIPLRALLRLAEIPGVQLYALQVGPARDQIAEAGPLVTDLAGRIRDWADTADLMMALDVIVSVDTGCLHLAGALGLPVLALLPFNACWRWLRGREDSPWYAGMTLLRQPRPGDWASVIDRAAAILEEKASKC